MSHIKIKQHRWITLIITFCVIIGFVTYILSNRATAQLELGMHNKDSLILHNKQTRECKDMLRMFSSIVQPLIPIDSVYRFVCHAETHFTDSAKIPPSIVDVEYKIGTSMLMMDSKLFSVYMDTSNVFSIIHPKRTIYRSDPVKDSLSPLKKILPIQDSLIARCDIVSCIDSYDSIGQKIRKIELTVDAIIAKQTNISKIYLMLNVDKLKADKIVVVPNAVKPIAYYSWEFSSAQYIAKNDNEIEFDVSRKVLVNNKLIQQWQDYTVVDNRAIANAEFIKKFNDKSKKY